MSEGIPAEFIRDSRSRLAKVAGDQAIPHVTFEDFGGVGGRFLGQPFALVAIPAEAELQSLGDAVAWLTAKDGCRLTREDFLTPDGESALDFEQKVQQLHRALRDPDDLTRNYAATAHEVRGLLFPDEIHTLYARHRIYQAQRSPLTSAERWEEVAAKVEALGKGSLPETWLSGCDADTLRLITRELASRLYGLTKGNSSPTSAPRSTGVPSSGSAG